MKTALVISVQEEDAEAIRIFCEKTGLTISSLFEHHTAGIAKAARLSGILDKKTVGKLDLMKFFAKAAMQDA